MIKRKKMSISQILALIEIDSYINIGKQLSRLECRSDKAVVAGSIPALPTSNNKILYNI